MGKQLVNLNFIEASVQSQKSKRSRIYVLVVSSERSCIYVLVLSSHWSRIYVLGVLSERYTC